MTGHHGIVVLKNYAEASGAVSGETGRTCQRCHARLRRTNTSADGLCAPCEAAIAPSPTAPWTCPSCHGPKTERATRCRQCDRARRTWVAA